MDFKRFCKTIVEKVDLLGTKPKDYNKQLIKKGAKIEQEHTNNKKAAKKIAMQHSSEFAKVDKNKKIDSEYYNELDKMESKLKKNVKRSFKDIVDEVVKETTMASSGTFGTSPEIGQHGGQVGNSDWYAPGDSRNLFGSATGKKNKKKRKIIRRSLARKL